MAEPGIATALRRVVVGYRVVGALWLCLLAGLALSRGLRPVVPVLATMAVALVWAALTVAVAARPRLLKAWPWLAADVVVAATTVVLPVAAAGMTSGFFGGYPFSALALAAVMRGLAAGLISAAVLAGATITRLAMLGTAAPQAVVETVVFYAASAAILGWGTGVVLRNDAQRRAAEAALAEERAERVRSQERAETAAHLHDSVLQTLALIQRRSVHPGEVTALARRQERELREWLSGGRDGLRGADADGSFDEVLARAAAEIEADHHLTVELVTVGDAPLDDDVAALVAATREALTNAAKHGGVTEVSVYAEAAPEQISVFVRDRGAGFDPAAVADDRRGISESIVARMARHGGRAVVHAAPGSGTEVELVLPRPPGSEPSAGPADGGQMR